MEEIKNKLKINRLDGTFEEVEKVVSFEFNDTKKRYMIYTKNEKDQNGNVTIYVTEVISDVHGIRVVGVSTDDEWASIKDVLRTLAKNENQGESFKIINESDFLEVEQINASKKLKTRFNDFCNILESGRVVDNVKQNDSMFDVTMNKLDEEENYETEYTNYSYEDNSSVEEKIQSDVYNTPKEESIDLKHIKDLENIYKGHKPIREVSKIEKEEPQEEVITEEMFKTELEKQNFSQEASNFKENLKNQYNAVKRKIKEQKDKIDDITREYSLESERCNMIREEKKDIQKVLNGMNAWQMEFFAKFKNEQRTMALLNSIEEYFSSYRKDLEEKIRAEKAGEERKEALGKAEQKAREAHTYCRKQLSEFINKNYKTLKEVNRHDEVLRENDAELKSLTGVKDLESLYLNSEKDTLNFSRNSFNVNQPQREVINPVPELNNTNFGNTINDNKPNIFDVFRRAEGNDSL